MKRKTSVALFALGAVIAGSVAAADGKATYDSVCFKCHRVGLDEAPRAGNKEEWAPRIATGLPELYKSVIEGKGAMEPRGNRPELTDDEIKAAVDYLVNLAK